MSEENIRVRCISCGSNYTTSQEAFDGFKCNCPICGSSKAQALD